MARMEFPLGDYKVYLSSDRAHADILAQGNPLTPPPCRRRSWPSTGSPTWWSPASP